jgi:predicted permease
VPRAAEISVDARVVVFAFLMSAAAGLLAGLAPARQMSRLDVVRGLRDGSRTVAGGARASRNSLVIGQLALSVVLLTAAGLTIRTLDELHHVDLGFAPERILTVRVSPRDRPEAFVAALLARVRALPDVVMAGAVSNAPMTAGNLSLHVFPVGEALILPTESIQVDWRIVTDGYFGAMETPVVAGRDFTTRDDDDAPKVIVVNQVLARRLWGERDPIGRLVDLGGGGGEPAMVVGLVRDMRQHNPAVPATPTYYVSAARGVWGGMTFAVRIAPGVDDPMALVPRIREAVAGLDPSLPVFAVDTMESLVTRQLAPQRLTASVLTGFGALALVLAVLGIYGVMAFTTRQRTRDAAIRLALGAPRWHVIGPLVREGSLLVVGGVAAGLMAALPLAHLMRSQLSYVSPADPLTFSVAVGILAASGLSACYLPARRASRVNPLEALRGE